jgi:cell division septation protein DedD
MSTVTDPHTDEHGVATPDETGDTVACPNCGSPADHGQLMCLECGNRLALDYGRPPAWRLPAAIVAALLVIAGLGVAIAVVGGNNNSKTTAAAPPAQSTAPAAPSAPADTPPTASTAAATPTASTPTPAPTTTGATAAPAPSGGAPAGTTSTPTPAPSTTPSGWPPGKSAFTVILASLPSKAAADDKLKSAQAAGITGAAILHSDDFPTLKPGYWVVFDGQYASIDQAQSQAATDRGKGEFTDAYPRFVSKDANAKP